MRLRQRPCRRGSLRCIGCALLPAECSASGGGFGKLLGCSSERELAVIAQVKSCAGIVVQASMLRGKALGRLSRLAVFGRKPVRKTPCSQAGSTYVGLVTKAVLWSSKWSIFWPCSVAESNHARHRGATFTASQPKSSFVIQET